jgi:hypothetical protein
MGVPMKPLKPYLVEATIGLVIALLLLWVAVAAVTDVPFVYQGL